MTNNSLQSSIINPRFNTIIFDLNGTITRSVSKHPRHILYRNRYIEKITKTPIRKNLSKTTHLALKVYGLDPDKYYQVRNRDIDWNIFTSYSESTFNTLSELQQLGYQLVLYTDCFMSQIKPTLDILKSSHFFKLIVSRELGLKKPNPQAYLFIAQALNVTIDQLLMVANDWKQDLDPLVKLGGNAIWIPSEKYLQEAKKEILIQYRNTHQMKSSSALNTIQLK